MTGVVSASEKIPANTSKSEASKSVSSRAGSTAISKEVKKSVNDVKTVTNNENKLSDNVKIIGWSSVKDVTDSKICDDATERIAMNTLRDTINEEIYSKNIKGIKATTEGNRLVLVVNTENDNQDLTPYVNSLINLLLGYNDDSIWSKLNQKGFNFNISSVTQLIDVNLGLKNKKIFDLNVLFNGCHLDFQLEFRTSTYNKICDKGTTRTALNIMKDAVNEEISSKNITGIMATVEGGKLVLILNKDKKIWDLTPYKDSLTNLLLGYDEVSIRSKLKQKGFLFDISTVSQLIDINLWLNNKKIFDLNVQFVDCSVLFQLEFRTNNSSTQICDNTTTNNALILMKDAINEEILGKNATGIRATIDGNNLVLMVNKDKQIWDLTPYVTSLTRVILGYDDDTIWYRLAQKWFTFDVSNVTQLINVKLGVNNIKLYDMSVRFNDCLVKFQLEFRNDNTSIQICNANTTNSALITIKNAINEEILNKNATWIKASIEGNKIVLALSNGRDIPDLTPYVQPLYDVILGYNTVSIRSKLAEKGFIFTSSNVTLLYNIILRTNDQKIFDAWVLYGDCLVNFQLEFRDANSSAQTCDANTANNAMNILKTAVDEELTDNKISWIKTSIENNILVLTFDKGKEVHDLAPYINSLINQILWIESNSIWSKLANQGFLFDVSDVNQLININLGLGSKNSFDLSARLNDCILKFKLELRVDNSNANNWSSSGWGYSWGWGSSRWWSSSSNRSNSDDEDLSFWGEVSDLERACSIEWSTYSDELNKAYMWACKRWIVAADNIMKANLKNPITRAELDKMLSIYAIKLLWMKHATEKSVTYPDVSNKLGDLAFYIQEWYKLQIMWIHADGTPLSRFSPNSLVTRWEFWTVFSRILYGNEYNIESSSYYTKHLDLLKNAGILSNTNPKIMEKRSRILLMLYRSQNVKKSNWSISLEDIAAIVAGK